MRLSYILTNTVPTIQTALSRKIRQQQNILCEWWILRVYTRTARRALQTASAMDLARRWASALANSRKRHMGIEGLLTYKYKLYGNGQIVADYASGKKEFHFKRLYVIGEYNDEE